MTAKSIGAALGVVMLTGCFQYRAADPRVVVPAGQAVRLELTDMGRVAVAPMAGEGVEQIDGIVESYAPESVALRVTALRRRSETETWTKERLQIAGQDIRTLSVKKFSTARTAVLVGAAILAGTTIRLGGFDGLGGGRRSNGSSGTR